MPSENLQLDFFLPYIGKVTTILHNESRDIYKLLEDKKEIERLKKLDHLGALKYTFESAHHSRWEYVILTLALIDVAKRSKFFGLSSNFKDQKFDLELSSSEELLKSWTLLHNIGHLYLTFTTEKCLLSLLISKRKLKKEYLELIEDDELKEWCKMIIKDENIYKFYHTITAFRLYTEFKSDGEKFDKIIKIFKCYIIDNENSEKLNNLKTLFKIIRQISYLALDPQYSPAAASININILLRDPDIFVDFVKSTVEIENDVNLLKQLNLHLYQNVYIGEKAMKNLTLVEISTNERLKEIAKDKSIQNIVKDLIDYDWKKQENCLTISTICRFNLFVPDIFSILLKPVKICSNQKKEQSNLKNNGYVNIWTSPMDNYYVIQYFSSTNDNDKEKEIYKRAFLKARELYDYATSKLKKGFKISDPELLNDIAFKNIAKELITRAISILSNNQFNCVWNGEEPHAFLGYGNDSKNYLKKLIPKKPYKTTSTISELEARYYFLRNNKIGKKVFLAISLVGIKLNDKDRETIAELDGIIIGLDKKNQLLAYLIEVKKKMKGGKSEAKKSLSERLEKMKIKKEKVKINSLKQKGKISIAYCEFPF